MHRGPAPGPPRGLLEGSGETLIYGNEPPAPGIGMALRTQEWIVILLLALSVAVSAVMLVTDDVLREVSPTHWYAVIGFIVVFLILIGLIVLRPARGLLATMGWSALLTVAMLVDPLTANGPDLVTGEPIFGGLSVQEAYRFLWTEQAYFTFPILFGLVVLTLLFAWRARRSLSS